MTLQEQYIERLKGMVVIKYGRDIATVEECSALAEAVAEATDMHLSGRDYASLFLPQRGIAPRPVTLSALAQYVGYDSWSSFCSSSDVTPAEDSDILPTPRYWGVAILTALAVIVVIITAMLLLGDGDKEEVSSNIVVELVTSVEDRWSARTVEECNAMRAYIDDKDYAERVDSFIDKYCATLYDDISAELIYEAQQSGIELSDEDLALYTEHIVTSCSAMCQSLVIEIDTSIGD